MEKEILELLNSMIINMNTESIPKTEREEVKCNKNKNQSFSFIVFKNILLKLTCQKTRLFIEFRMLDNIDLPEIKNKFKEVKYKENELYVKVYIDNIDEIKVLQPELEEIYKYLYLNESVEAFGCCSKYIQCSNSLKCVNTDKKLAKACQYKGNLDNGKIFYGRNKNI